MVENEVDGLSNVSGVCAFNFLEQITLVEAGTPVILSSAAGATPEAFVPRV